MADLAELTRVCQILLEHHRAHADDDEMWDEFVKARNLRDLAWLERVALFPHPLP